MAAGDLALRIIITASGSEALATMGAISSEADMMSTGVGMAAVVAAAGLAAFAIASVKTAGDFQQQMNHIEAFAGVAHNRIEDLSSKLLAMAPIVGQTPTTLAKALFQIVSSSIPANEQLALLQESAQMATGGMADTTDVTKAMIFVMKDFGLTVPQAADKVTAAVTFGRMTMSDYANSIGIVAAKGALAHRSFDEINAAMDVLTVTTFPSAQQAARNLGQLYIQMDVGVDALATRADKMGLSFDEASFKTMSFGDQIKYLTTLTGGNTEELRKLIGGGVYAIQTFEALSSHSDLYAQTLDKLKHASDGVGAAQAQWNVSSQGFNVKMQQLNSTMQVLMIVVSNTLIPIVENFAGAISTVVSGLTSWLTSQNPVNDALSLTGKYSQWVLPILIGLGTTIAILVVPPLIAAAGAILAAIGPALLIGAAIGLVVAAFVHWYNTNIGFKITIDAIWGALVSLWQIISTNIGPILQQVGAWLAPVGAWFVMVGHAIEANFVPTLIKIGQFVVTYVWPILVQLGQYLANTFKPVWVELVDTWNATLLPVFKQVWGALQQLKPVLIIIGGLVALVIVGAFFLLVGVLIVVSRVINVLLQVLSTVLRIIIWVIGGVVQNIGGAIEIITGIILFIYDLITLNFTKLGSDLGIIWQGIVNSWEGLWTTVGAIFWAFWTLISGFFQVLWEAIIHTFQSIYDALVGHSIIPDLINKIVSLFTGLWSWLTSIWNNIKNAAVNGWNDVSSSVMNVVNGLKDKIGNAWGMVKDKMSQVFGSVKDVATQKWNDVKGVIKDSVNGIIYMLNGMIDGWNNIAGSMHLPTFGHIPYLAMGGDNLSAGPYWVGDAGPELLWLPQGSSVMSNAESQSYMQQQFALGGGGGATIIIQAPSPAPIYLDKQQIGEAVLAYAAKQIRIQGAVKR